MQPINKTDVTAAACTRNHVPGLEKSDAVSCLLA